MKLDEQTIGQQTGLKDEQNHPELVDKPPEAKMITTKYYYVTASRILSVSDLQRGSNAIHWSLGHCVCESGTAGLPGDITKNG
ncbi:hypothetical protein GJ744_010508 [Endocarpon pusillum]|uniref:Uncharacterized protein n=1 Tax=Endocarpon pusillum TaxID=364733 RepID=A0A8H7AUC4_9EURO|nr:hypothetical protein GJ744_010508 [Endocarpon pusillum]